MYIYQTEKKNSTPRLWIPLYSTDIKDIAIVATSKLKFTDNFIKIDCILCTEVDSKILVDQECIMDFP